MIINRYRSGITGEQIDEWTIKCLSDAVGKGGIDLLEQNGYIVKSGIYEYLLSEKENEKVLNIRAFTANQKREAYERQKGICPICGEHFDFDEMEGDHITPWSQGGKTNAENCKMLCRECNRRKSDK